MNIESKKIRDNIHGSIEFDSCFTDLLTSKFFKRLHRITQMGMAPQVFPAAVHTRFSHSVGVFHNMRKLINSDGLMSKLPGGKSLSDQDKFFLLTAALLHDIGHLPLSHTIESAMERFEEYRKPTTKEANYNAARDILEKGQKMLKSGDVDFSEAALHEQLSAEVIKTGTLSSKIKEALKKHSGQGTNTAIDHTLITYGILGKNADKESEEIEQNLYYQIARFLLHSQIDADRLDYLLRDSSTSGVKTSGFDVDTLIAELRIVEANGKFKYGISERGLRAFEEYLFARAYNYLNIVFDSEMQGLGLLAEDFYFQLLLLKEKGYIKPDLGNRVFSFKDLKDKLCSGNIDEFIEFDDTAFYDIVEIVRNRNGNEDFFIDKKWPTNKVFRDKDTLKEMADMLSDGTPPKLMWRNELWATKNEYRKKSSLHGHNHLKRINNAIEKSGISNNRLLFSDEKSRVKLLDNSARERICLIKDNGEVLYDDFSESTSSIFYSLRDSSGQCKNFYVDAAFYIGNCTEKAVRNFSYEMNQF